MAEPVDIYGRKLTDDDIGRAVVACPGCGQERWHGYGPCRECGAPGTAGRKAGA
jgi:hypothetical protein